MIFFKRTQFMSSFHLLVVWYESHGGSLSELNWEFEVLRGWCTTQLVKEKGQSTSSTNEALP